MRKKLLSLFILTLPLSSFAADTVTLNVTGSLHQPTSCDVKASSTTVAFGNILSSKINGTEYKKDLNVSVTCTNRNPIQSVNIQVTGSGTTTNKLPISGTAKGFVLALKRGSANQNFASNIANTADGSLNLSLTPELKANEKFVTGAFTAALTVKVTIA